MAAQAAGLIHCAVPQSLSATSAALLDRLGADVYGSPSCSAASSKVAFSSFEGLRSSRGSRPRQTFLDAAIGTSNNDTATSHHARPAPGSIKTTTCVALPANPPPATGPAKRNKVELYKEESGYLRHPVIEELQTEATGINEAAAQIIKFHGMYLQDNREERAFGAGKSYQFMIRTKQPAGKVTNRIYLLMDELADEFGIGTLRLTTRQTFQLHGIMKKDLKHVLSTIIKNFGSTLGTCGDLNRNTLAPPAPFKTDPAYIYAQEYAEKIAALLAPQAGAYYEVWLDDEKFMTSHPPEAEDVVQARNENSHGTNFEDSPEPIYGTQFLPRKFKIAVTVPGDNSVDILTNDIGLVVLTDYLGRLEGFNVYVGGGMGRSHRNADTFPHLAQPLGYVAKDDVMHAVKAIVATQRDYGRRDDRRQARMKYLIHEWGIDKFRTVAEQYFGKEFQSFKELPPWEFKNYLGWHEQGDGLWFLGIHIENGRVKGDAKKALRRIISDYDIPVRLTANQNMILCDIRPSWKAKIRKNLNDVGLVAARYIDGLNLTAMACPALPLCPLAVTEAERVLPSVLKRVRTVLEKVGLTSPSDAMVIRMTGCPNGCTRPYMAEIAFVGDGPSSYQVYLGGSRNQTRLATLFMDKMKVDDLEVTLEPMFHMYKTQRLVDSEKQTETFGDFAARAGFDAIRDYMASYPGLGKQTARPRIPVEKALYEELKSRALERGVTLSQLVTGALERYMDADEE